MLLSNPDMETELCWLKYSEMQNDGQFPDCESSQSVYVCTNVLTFQTFFPWKSVLKGRFTDLIMHFKVVDSQETYLKKELQNKQRYPDFYFSSNYNADRTFPIMLWNAHEFLLLFFSDLGKLPLEWLFYQN